jgi:hypothetical protein
LLRKSEMEIPDYKIRNRQFFFDKAVFYSSNENGFQSAVFFMECFNRWIRYQPKEETPPPISPEEIFGSYDENVLLAARVAVKKLLDQTAYVGAAALYYDGASSLEEARQRMKTENPGFYQECYERAEAHSRQEMR